MAHLDFSVGALFPNTMNAGGDPKCVAVMKLTKETFDVSKEPSKFQVSQAAMIELCRQRYYNTEQVIPLEGANELLKLYTSFGATKETAKAYITFFLDPRYENQWNFI